MLAPLCELAPELVLRGRNAREWLASRPAEEREASALLGPSCPAEDLVRAQGAQSERRGFSVRRIGCHQSAMPGLDDAVSVVGTAGNVHRPMVFERPACR